MNYMTNYVKIFIKVIILFLLIYNFWISNASFTQEDLSSYYNKLKLINSWEKYIKSIDLIMNKYWENEELLKKLQIRFEIINNNLSWKNDNRSKNLKIILDYFSLKVYFALDALDKQDKLIQKEIITDEIIVEDKTIIKDIVETNDELVFPGFVSPYNDKKKNVLAWTEEFVYAWWAWAMYEKAEVNSVIFYITWDNIDDLKYSIEHAYLYVEWLLLDTASYSDIEIIDSTKASISFDNINWFILPNNKQIDFRLAIKPSLIWYENIWKTMKDLIVSDIDFDKVIWLTSNRNITNVNISNFSSEYFSITPVLMNAWVIRNLNTSTQIELNLKWDFWQNKIDTNNSKAFINLDKIKFSVFWTDESSATYTLYNSNDSLDLINWNYNWWIIEFDLSTMQVKNKTVSSWNWENYMIRITWINTWITMELLKDWVIYNVDWISGANNLNINLQNSIDLGYRDF